MIITSRSNPLIKRAKSLKQKKYRDELGLFVLEGEKFVADALKAGFRCETLFCLPKFEGRYAGAKQEVLLTEEVFAALFPEQEQEAEEKEKE